jgi:ribosomal protein L11 methyltransferase
MIELKIVISEVLVEPVSDVLMSELDALCVSVEDADANTPIEQALFGEPDMPAPREGWNRSTLSALFQDQNMASHAADTLLTQDWASQLDIQGLIEVPDQDWVRLTQSQFTPVAITSSFWIVPSWHEIPPEAEKIIRLDPGLAFGTGTHPTTRMCLRWIAQKASLQQDAWYRVLDYGCGSGILAVAACLHGAQYVDAVDIDPAAVDATQINAKNNGVLLNAGLPETTHGLYNLVLANILSTPLKLLAPLLCQRLAPNASLVLSGILARQANELIDAYQPWLTLQVSDEEDGWILMTGHANISTI